MLAWAVLNGEQAEPVAKTFPNPQHTPPWCCLKPAVKPGSGAGGEAWPPAFCTHCDGLWALNTASFVSVPPLVKLVHTGGLPSSLQICWKAMAPIKDTFPSAYDATYTFRLLPARNPWGSGDCSGSSGLWHSIFLYLGGMHTTHLPSLHKDHLPRATRQNKTDFPRPHPGPWSLHAGTTIISIGIVFVVLFFLRKLIYFNWRLITLQYCSGSWPYMALLFFLSEVNFCFLEMKAKQKKKWIKIGGVKERVLRLKITIRG